MGAYYEELVGDSQEMMGLVLVNYLVKLLSIYSFGIPALTKPSIKTSLFGKTVGNALPIPSSPVIDPH